MSTRDNETPSANYPVTVAVKPATEGRNRLTTFFRVLLAIPHIILVGGPTAVATSFMWRDDGWNYGWGSGSGLLGAANQIADIVLDLPQLSLRGRDR